MIRTGRDRGSGLLGSQPQPVIPASVIPEELISQVTHAHTHTQHDSNGLHNHLALMNGIEPVTENKDLFLIML